jgi:hypothetical protein
VYNMFIHIHKTVYIYVYVYIKYVGPVAQSV